MSKIELYEHEIIDKGKIIVRFYNKENPEEEYIIEGEDLINCQIKLVKILYDIQDVKYDSK